MEIKRVQEESVEDILRLWAHLSYIKGREKTEYAKETKKLTDELYLRLRALGAVRSNFNTAFRLWAYEKDYEGLKELAREIEDRPISFKK